jgi:hypothetical protein
MTASNAPRMSIPSASRKSLPKLTMPSLPRRRRAVPDTATEERERAALRHQAQFDRSAARELRRRLRADLRSHAALRRDLERDGVTDRERALLLQNIDRVERAARQQIAEVEAWLRARG